MKVLSRFVGAGFWLTLGLTLGFVVTGHAQEGSALKAPEPTELNENHTCLVLKNGQRLLLQGDPVDSGALVRFVLKEGNGPYNVPRDQVDWPATQQGCAVVGGVAQAPPLDSPLTRTSAPLVTTEDVAFLAKQEGGQMSVLDHARSSGPSSFSQVTPPPKGFPVDRPLWQGKAQKLIQEKAALEERLVNLGDQLKRLERDLHLSYGYYPEVVATLAYQRDAVKRDIKQTKRDLRSNQNQHDFLRQQADLAGIPAQWVE